jgi:hypothetical protein
MLMFSPGRDLFGPAWLSPAAPMVGTHHRARHQRPSASLAATDTLPQRRTQQPCPRVPADMRRPTDTTRWTWTRCAPPLTPLTPEAVRGGPPSRNGERLPEIRTAPRRSTWPHFGAWLFRRFAAQNEERQSLLDLAVERGAVRAAAASAADPAASALGARPMITATA